MIDVKALKKVLELMCGLSMPPTDVNPAVTHGVWFDGDIIAATDSCALVQLRIDDASISHYAPKLVHAVHVRAACKWLATHRASDLRAKIAYGNGYVQLRIVSTLDAHTPIATYDLPCADGEHVEYAADGAKWRHIVRQEAAFPEEYLSSFGVDPKHLELAGALFRAVDVKTVFRPATHHLSPVQCENRHVSAQGGAEGVKSLIVTIAPVRL